MQKKKFKTESQKLLDMMINSIYTHKEIFLRELISNASDAIDKLYYRSLTDDSVKLKREDYAIRIEADKEGRNLIISDNGCGMTKDELENNLGTIAKSGSFDFKKENPDKTDVDIIGQFGVGFYSAFMVSDKITVVSKAYGSDEAWKWESEGIDGYTIEPCDKEEAGTTITMHLKEDTDDEKYSDYLNEYTIRRLIKKYSDYIRYPIKMDVETEKLKEGGNDLNDGAQELLDGANELKEGVEKFNEEGVEKITDFVDQDLQDIIDRLKVLQDVSGTYKSFSSESDENSYSVKFIIETRGIE